MERVVWIGSFPVAKGSVVGLRRRGACVYSRWGGRGVRVLSGGGGGEKASRSAL